MTRFKPPGQTKTKRKNIILRHECQSSRLNELRQMLKVCTLVFVMLRYKYSKEGRIPGIKVTLNSVLSCVDPEPDLHSYLDAT